MTAPEVSPETIDRLLVDRTVGRLFMHPAVRPAWDAYAEAGRDAYEAAQRALRDEYDRALLASATELLAAFQATPDGADMSPDDCAAYIRDLCAPSDGSVPDHPAAEVAWAAYAAASRAAGDAKRRAGARALLRWLRAHPEAAHAAGLNVLPETT